MNLLEIIKESARKQPKKIVLPEGSEERTLRAAEEVLKERIAEIILIGNQDEIRDLARTNGLGHLSNAVVVNPETAGKKNAYANLMVELRGHKGMTLEKAYELLKDPFNLQT